MDNPLMTPNKIQKWMHLAEDKSYRTVDYDEENARSSYPVQIDTASSINCEKSSGILDLEHVEGFDEEDVDNAILYKSATTFNPSEMTGRSTCSRNVLSRTMPLSAAVDQIQKTMDTQTSQVENIIRASICSSFSFHSKRNLTADEESFIRKEGTVPVYPSQSLRSENTEVEPENISVGAYFQKRCTNFGTILANINSPERGNLPRVCEAQSQKMLPISDDSRQTYEINKSLDSIPIRQRREIGNDQNLEKYKIPDPVQNIMEQYKAPEPMPVKEITKSTAAVKSNEFLKQLGGRCADKSFGRKPNVSKVASSTVSQMYDVNSMQYSQSLLSCAMPRSAYRIMTEESESTENSISLSKIADYIGKQSELSVTELMNNKRKQQTKKSPLAEVQMNVQDNKNDHQNSETISSGTLSTVVSFDKLHIDNDKNDQDVAIIREWRNNIDDLRTKTPNKCKSPYCKNPLPLSTIQENSASFKSEESALQTTKGEGSNESNVPSPNISYKELDKSIDWKQLMGKGFKQHGLAKEEWIEIVTSPAKGFLGITCSVIVSITNLTDSWLTAKFQFDCLANYGNNITIELPRQPLLLSPRKTEKFYLHLTLNEEIRVSLPYSLFLKDTSIDKELESKQNLDVDIQVPIVQAMSQEGLNKVNFSPIQEKGNFIKHFVLISDCPADLQLELSVDQGESIFSIKNVQEIKRVDVKKVIMEGKGYSDESQGKAKGKSLNKQLCRLTSGNAIKVTMKFIAPKLSDLNITDTLVTFKGTLHVNLIGVSNTLRKINLMGVVGCTNLVIKGPADKLCLTNDPVNITLCNTGTVAGGWIAKFTNNTHNMFKANPSRVDISSGGTKTVALSYTGSEDNVSNGSLAFEDIVTGQKTIIEICAMAEKSKIFPIKTNFGIMSWVRAGRKELSLKNSTDKRVIVRCQIIGEGFSIDLPGNESRGVYSLHFGPCECRPLSVIFAPKTMLPKAATLVLVSDKNGGLTRKIKLYGCASGESMRWSGLVTYGDTALVRANSREPIKLELYNKSDSANFVCAQIYFNVQYRWAEHGSRLEGGRSVVRARSRHNIVLSVEWSRVERRARHSPPPSALATLHVLTGHELTRRRILKIIRNESDGEIDSSLLPEHLKVLTEQLEGEDPSVNNMLEEFQETKASLNELIGGLQELTAQIDLPQDYPEEATIIVNDETIVEHHTLCE